VRQVLEKFGRMQLKVGHFPASDGRELTFELYIQPERDQQRLLAELNWELPPKSTLRIKADGELEIGYRPSLSDS